MTKNAYEYVLVNAERVGGSQTVRRCREAMDAAINALVSDEASTVAAYLDDRALTLHKEVASIPTTEWTTDDWETLGMSNASSFAATYIRKWFGGYLHNAPSVTAPYVTGL